MNNEPQQPPDASGSSITSAPAAGGSSRAERIAKIGTVLSAILASSCCWLPILLLAVGVSGAGIAASLAEYRPVFMVVTFAFLGAAFYFTYRPRRAAIGSGDAGTAATGGDCCSDADCCAPAAGRRFNMMALNKIMLWAVTVMAVAFLFFPKYFTSMLVDGGESTAEFTDEMTRTSFQLEGLWCEGCVPPAAKAIRTTPGVLAVKVNYITDKKSVAVVGTAPDQPVPRQEIIAALKAVGFGGRSVEP